MAEYWTVEGLVTLRLAGSTVIDCNVALVTVSDVEPTTRPSVALMVVTPGATDVASPSVPAELLIAATPTSVDVQVTCVVRSWLDPSE